MDGKPVIIYIIKTDMRHFSKLLYAAWLGISLAHLGFNVTDWQFYFVSFPTIFLVAIFHDIL